MRLRRLLAAAACAAPAFAPLGAQAVRTLPKAAVEHDQPFTAISGVRELADGRVIVSDGREKTLQVIDLRRRSAASIGRDGAGPAEWRSPSRLFAMPGDSTLMPDFGNERWFIIGPDAKPATTVRMPDEGRLESATLVGIDPRGRFIFVVDRFIEGPRRSIAPMADVMRYDRATQRLDSLATLRLPENEMTGSTMVDATTIRLFTNLPLAGRDIAAVASDGRVAILRASPYRVEWVGLDGRVTTGPNAVSSGVRITQAEKDAFIASQTRPGSIQVRLPGGASAPPPPASGAGRAAPGGAVSMSAADRQRMTNPDMTWPAEKPPFLTGAALAAPDGRLWVLRTRAHDDSVPSYDVFDAAGKVVERVRIPARTRIAGFGKGAVYLARTDDDELVWLQRVTVP